MCQHIRYAEAGWNHEEHHNLSSQSRMEGFLFANGVGTGDACVVLSNQTLLEPKALICVENGERLRRPWWSLLSGCSLS